jgi:hypothetical protein
MSAPPAPRGHSALGMSVLERRHCCPGSMRMEAGKADTPSIYAKRGTELHAAAAECLLRGLSAAEYIPDDPDGIAIVEPYLDQVRAAHGRLGGQLLVEQAFHLEALHELYWGTADAVVLAPPKAWVGDLKTGAGHAVPIRREDGRVNFQLGGYGLGAVNSLPEGLANQITSVELCVCQPRLGPAQRTVMDLADMQDLAADLIDTAEAALRPDAPLVPGDHCTFCRARGDCPALRAAAWDRAAVDFDVVNIDAPKIVFPAPASLTPEQLSRALTGADLMDTWIHGVRVHAKQLADHGHEIPNWKLVNKIGRRIWVDEVEALKSLAFMPTEDLYVVKPVSPPQAEKALKKLKLRKPDDWDDIVTMSDPGTALVPAGDKRPAVSPRLVEFEVEPNAAD